MLRCRELSRLSRASKPRSVNFRRTTPGYIGPLLSWQTEAPPAGRIDARHPTYHTSRHKLGQLMPNASTTAFTLRAFPKGVLYFPPEPFGNPPHTPAATRAGRHNMSLMMMVGKKGVHKHAAVRRAVVNKIRTAVGLIVARGAKKGVDARRREVLTFTNEPELGMANPEWTYIMAPRLEVYRMPWPRLVDQLRFALEKIAKKIVALENVWHARKGRSLRGKDSEASILEAWIPEDPDVSLGADKDRGTVNAGRNNLARKAVKNNESMFLESEEDFDFDKLVGEWLDESALASAPSPSPPSPTAQPTSSVASMLFRKPIIRAPKPKTLVKKPK